MGKNNYHLKNIKEGTKVESYSIKKFKVGAASVVIGASIFFGAGAVAQASESVSNNTVTDESLGTEKKLEVAPKAQAKPVVENTRESVSAALASKLENSEKETLNKVALTKLIEEIDGKFTDGKYASKTEDSVNQLKVALEKAFIIGDGKSQPIGLNRDLLAAVTQGQYAEKASAGTLTFKDTKTIIAEIAGVHKNLAKYKRLKKDGVTEEDEFQARNIAGKVVMLINPFEYYDIMARATVQNASGTFITALPFNPTIIESIFVPTGKVIFFVEGEYLAITAGSFGISQFKETLAMEDATLYITKMYANGKPKDNYAAQVYNLNITPLA